jgi:thiamine-phosphate pyrophosphorylase
MNKKLFGIYAITDNSLTPNSSITKKVKSALIGGAKIIQFRDKISSDSDIEDIVKQLQLLCKNHKAIFILNDRVSLACKLKVDGIHIGRDDIELKEARSRFDGIIGVSCYNDLKLALKAQSNGADYVAFGAMFTSSTKKDAKLATTKTIQEAKKRLTIPICLIGGIDSKNISTLLALKPDMIAVVNDIFKDENIVQNTEKLQDKFKRDKKI